MLIKSLHAINFRKYHKLIVEDIPESGVITVSGSNESGKTSIGEAICFALYGRTFFLNEDNLKKIVCWGTDVAEVTLEFKSGQGDTYELWRSVDRKGETHVKLRRIATEIDIIDESTELQLKDDEGVRLALKKILGFDYDAFANSFYLAQRELTSPDPQSQTIKQMAGISAYATITDDFAASNAKHKEAIQEIEPQVDSTQAELDAINLDETWLPELIDAEETLGAEQKQRETLVSQINSEEQFYTNNFQAFHSARKLNVLSGFVGKLLVPIALILWILWVANKYFNEVFTDFLTPMIGESGFQSFATLVENWAMPAVILAVIIFFLSLLLKKKSKQTMSSLTEEAHGFSRSLKDGHRYVTTLVESLMPERVVQLLHQRTDESSPTLQVLPAREQFNNLTHLMQAAPEFQADSGEITAAVSRLSDALKKQDGEIIDLSNNLLDDISEEKTRSDIAGNLRSTLQGLHKVVDKCNYSIDTQNIAIGLMQRAAKSAVDLFNKNISDISANTLPRFTEKRYSELRIAEDFSVQVYSDEKKDYMDFDEISSGTQRQIMLALRMAMSEELAINTGNDHQFLFLDEPFAFFDQHRTKSTLLALPDISDVISQIWISAQEFPSDVDVNKAINCPLDETELVV